MKKVILAVLVLGVIAWPSVSGTNAQDGVSDIVIQGRVFNDDPNSTFDSLKALPVVALADTHVSHPGPFANRHVWRVATGPNEEDIAVFGINDPFDVSFDLIVLANADSPRTEAGILVSTSIGDGQFIVNTDAHEVVIFGGPFPFYAFNQQEGDKRVTYNTGDKINLRMRYFIDMDGKRKVEYLANGKSSGAIEFTNLEQGLPEFAVGGYIQIPINMADPNRRAVAVFDNIRWNGQPIGN